MNLRSLLSPLQRPAPWLALILLAMTLLWQVPMMLWDHLDLVPMLAGWKEGGLGASGFLDTHGAHLHNAAYVLLLASTLLSGGRPWLDCLISWLLLAVFAWLVLGAARALRRPGEPAWPRALMVLLVLHPGHLANLQWGWQVAVFLCLVGMAGTVLALTAPQLDAGRNLLALFAGALALLSFATALALLPVAMALIALRGDLPWRRRGMLLLPWAVVTALVLVSWRPQGEATGFASAVTVLYGLNFLGAGIARFATDLAPVLAGAALIALPWLYRRQPDRLRALPWLGFAVLGIGSAALVALGRAADWGPDQAFATRYVSFSLLFWIGCTGLAVPLLPQAGRLLRGALLVVAVFAAANALHMVNKAAQVGTRSAAIAAGIRDSYPDVDPAVLADIYFGQREAAAERIRRLHEWGYAPFDRTRPTP